MISIIVPIYNAEITIHKCIDSILSQKYADFELLLIDDGSSDNSAKICDTYSLKDKRIKTFHQKNQGVSAARNLGLYHAKGEFITFCDSDDYVENTWLSDYIENYNGEDILFQNFICHNEYPGQIKRRDIRIDNSLPLQQKIALLYQKNVIGYVWSALFKASIIRNHKLTFSIHYKYREDYIFCLNCCRYIKSINIIQNANYHYIFPTSNRAYNNFSINRFSVFYEESSLIHSLTGRYFDIIHELVSNNILYSIYTLLDSNLTIKEKFNYYKMIKTIPFILFSSNRQRKMLFFAINNSPLIISFFFLYLRHVRIK